MAIEDFPVLVNDFTPGFQTKRSPSDLPLGAAQDGQNIRISDGDKIEPIEGWTLFGAADSNALPITSATTFVLSTGLEIPIRSSGTVLEYYHEGTAAWENLNDGYTTGLRFGFANFYDSSLMKDFIYFGNGTEPYSRWIGAYDQLDGALSGGETEIQVDTVFTDRVHYSGTASSVTTTTIDIADSDWATDIWNDIYYVHITSGAQSGKAAKITDGTDTQITFDTITGLSGTPTFEIRQAKFASSGTLRIGTTDVTYTSIDQENRFAGCASVPAASDNAAISQAVTTYPANPKGNIFICLDERMYVCHDLEATVNVSATSDATDFTFSSPRAAGEGDLGLIPEGGGGIKGLSTEERKLIILKRNIIKELAYSQDANDLPQLNTLIESPGVGTNAPASVFKVNNDSFYTSPEGGVKAVGRVPEVNFVQALQIADPIRTTVNLADFSSAAGGFFNNKAYIAAKETSSSSANDIVFVFNFEKKAWELPIKGVNATCFFIYDSKFYFGDAFNKETYQLETGDYSIYKGTTDYPYKAVWKSGLINYDLPANRKGLNTYFVEGFIAENTEITFRLEYEYQGIYRKLSGTIDGSDEDIILKPATGAPLGVSPLGVAPLGAGDETPNELNKFRVYFTTNEIPFYEHSITFESDGKDQRWEILRFGPNAIQLKAIDPKIKKALT